MLRNSQLSHDFRWQLRQSLGFSEILIDSPENGKRPQILSQDPTLKVLKGLGSWQNNGPQRYNPSNPLNL